MTNAPERIYLQWNAYSVHRGTWSETRRNETQTEYIRADIHDEIDERCRIVTAKAHALEAERDALKSANESKQSALEQIRYQFDRCRTFLLGRGFKCEPPDLHEAVITAIGQALDERDALQRQLATLKREHSLWVCETCGKTAGGNWCRCEADDLKRQVGEARAKAFEEAITIYAEEHFDQDAEDRIRKLIEKEGGG